jgi:hypothetical protein
VTYRENTKKAEKTFQNIWSVKKKAVPLQPISQQTQVSG